MKRGFTLIELLAVIVILAIIALIAVPIVINIINDSKKSSEKESIKLYMYTVEKAITKKQMSIPKFKPEECTIVEKKLKCGEDTLEIEIKGQTPESGIIKIENNKLEGINLKLNGLFYQVKNGEVSDGTTEKSYSEYVTLVSDVNHDGKVSIGDEYTYKVNEIDAFTFYVLSIEGTGANQKVNLIMDRNICNDGTIEYTSTNNYCRNKWYSSANNNRYGPTTVMAELYAGTKDWDNVPTIELSGQNKYTDEANNTETDKGYTSLEITGGVAIITGKPDTNITTIGTSSKPLKARIPKNSEVTGAGCTTSNGSCPTWLMGYMTYWNGANNKYSMNNNNEDYQNQINGYWLLSSFPGESIRARRVGYGGSVGSYGNTTDGRFGARPVITVPISALGN